MWGVPGPDLAAPDMGRVPGRDSVRVPQKGQLRVEEFNTEVRRNVDNLGPGVYHQEEDLWASAAGGVRFKDMLNRQEVSGPRGERPAMYQDRERGRVNEGVMVEDSREELILDGDKAKEELMKRAPSVLLYNRVGAAVVCCSICAVMTNG